MKNLHLIPTEKPSRLVIDTIENKLYLQPILHKKTINVLPQHIYITSDEEIKEGNWCYAILSKQVFKNANPNLKSEDKKKIILTTDKDLIEDGVQAIDDEFLEWFVENPSCESVPIIPPLFGHPYIIWIEGLNFKIPEEPKQIKCYCGHTTYCDCGPLEEPKQETLEEASWKYNPLKKLDGEFIRHAFKKGAKWQQERMYSEEDMKLAYFSAIQSTGEGWNGEYAEGNNPNIEDKFSEEFKEWFEQFKKNGGDR